MYLIILYEYANIIYLFYKTNYIFLFIKILRIEAKYINICILNKNVKLSRLWNLWLNVSSSMIVV